MIYTLTSQVIVWLPCLPVPLSLQPAPLFVAALVLGWPAVIAYGMYLLEGALGLPVFAGFLGGAARLLGPTGGYLWGFGLAMIFLSLVRNYIFCGRTYPSRQPLRGFLRTSATGAKLQIMLVWAAVIYGNIIAFAWGLTQLAWFMSADKLLEAGLYPFIIGDFVLKPLLVLTCVRLLTVTQKTNI